MNPVPRPVVRRDWIIPADLNRTRVVYPPITIGDSRFTVSSGCSGAETLWVVQTEPTPITLGAVRRSSDGSWRAHFAQGVPMALTDAVVAAIAAFAQDAP